MADKTEFMPNDSNKSLWQQIKDGIKNFFKKIGSFFSDVGASVVVHGGSLLDRMAGGKEFAIKRAEMNSLAAEQEKEKETEFCVKCVSIASRLKELNSMQIPSSAYAEKADRLFMLSVAFDKLQKRPDIPQHNKEVHDALNDTRNALLSTLNKDLKHLYDGISHHNTQITAAISNVAENKIEFSAEQKACLKKTVLNMYENSLITADLYTAVKHLAANKQDMHESQAYYDSISSMTDNLIQNANAVLKLNITDKELDAIYAKITDTPIKPREPHAINQNDIIKNMATLKDIERTSNDEINNLNNLIFEIKKPGYTPKENDLIEFNSYRDTLYNNIKILKDTPVYENKDYSDKRNELLININKNINLIDNTVAELGFEKEEAQTGLDKLRNELDNIVEEDPSLDFAQPDKDNDNILPVNTDELEDEDPSIGIRTNDDFAL